MEADRFCRARRYATRSRLRFSPRNAKAGAQPIRRNAARGARLVQTVQRRTPLRRTSEAVQFPAHLLCPTSGGPNDGRSDARMDPKLEDPRPVAPYENDIEQGFAPCLRSQFGEPAARAEEMASYRRRRAAALPSPAGIQVSRRRLERGRRSCDAGTSSRDTIEDIGKETDGWEEDDARTEDQDTVLSYPSSSLDRERMIERSNRSESAS